VLALATAAALTGCSGCEATKAGGSDAPGTLRVGAHDLLGGPQPDEIEEFGRRAVLGDAVRRIAECGCVLDPTIVSRLMSRARRDSPLGSLVEDERDLLALVAEGTPTRPSPTVWDSPDAMEAQVAAIVDRLGLAGTPDDLRRIVALLDFLRT
jgi:hypothetical protein